MKHVFSELNLTSRLLQNPVPSEPARTRLAIGVFDGLEDLKLALDELAANGAPEGAFLLLAEPGALHGEPDGAKTFERISSLAKWPTVVIRKRGEVNGGRGPLAPELQRIIDFGQWIEPATAVTLNREAKNGACLMFAIVSSPEQEREVCVTLMRHCVGQLHVHDLRT